MPSTLADEIARANQLAREMITEYVAWSGKITYGKELHAIYMETLDFVNFRIETADSCLLLLENGRVGDALGLSRSLLENYLLFMLMCRGTNLFQLQDLSGGTEGEFKRALAEKKAELETLQTAGTTSCLAVERYPRAKRHIMYVYEGLKSPDATLPDFTIPSHYFHFRQFNPETMRLKDENYFQYDEPSAATAEATRSQQEDQAARYRRYLSYDALLQCLDLNDLADPAAVARIEAHYTFLGRFLHPTNDAARNLHESPTVHDGQTRIGMGQTYAETAVLLAYLYVVYTLAATLDEAMALFEGAPAKYMADPGTADLRAATARVPADFPYFWFLFNDPPLYDRFKYCVSHATDDELAAWGGYEHVPLGLVPFNQHIYGHFKDGLNGWSNRRCGEYRSPLRSRLGNLTQLGAPRKLSRGSRADRDEYAVRVDQADRVATDKLKGPEWRRLAFVIDSYTPASTSLLSDKYTPIKCGTLNESTQLSALGRSEVERGASMIVIILGLIFPPFAHIRIAASMHSNRMICQLVLLAVRQHYGHRFEQNDDSFWCERRRSAFRGVVCC